MGRPRRKWPIGALEGPEAIEVSIGARGPQRRESRRGRLRLEPEARYPGGLATISPSSERSDDVDGHRRRRSDRGDMAPTFCDFCGRPGHEAGPLVEGKALVATGLKPQGAHICAQCAETSDKIFEQHERKNSQLERLPTPSGTGRQPRRLHHRPGPGEADARRRGDQPLQAGAGPRRSTTHRVAGRRGLQEQRPADRPDRLRQDGAGADPRAPAPRPVRHRRRHNPDRGRLRRRGRREPDPQARHGGRLRHPARPSAGSSTSTRSTRSARRARTSRSPATSRAKGSSRRS